MATATQTRHGRPGRVAARALTIGVVIAATLAGGYLALVSYSRVRALSVGEIRLSVSPAHKGALDLYVPLVDWGARFESIRLPVRLRVDVRTVDRAALQRVAGGAQLDVGQVRAEARDAIAGYLRALIGVVTACALGLGLLTAFAVRQRFGPRLRYTVAAATLTAVGLAAALVALLPPRGEIDAPEYYAYGADIPRALDAISSVRRSGRALDQELDAQLVGLARLVTAPGDRAPLEAHFASRSRQTSTTTSSHCRSSSARQATGRCSSPATCPTAARRSRPPWSRVSRRSAGRSCSSPVTMTPTARRRSWPMMARSC